MAYVDQTKKAKIMAALKPVMPRDWKWSLAVRHHSTIVLTITKAPVNLVDKLTELRHSSEVRVSALKAMSLDVNPYHWRDGVAKDEIRETFERIFDALNTDNYDRSDSQTDYFCVGHYVDVKIGRWNKPFVVTEPKVAKALAPHSYVAKTVEEIEAITTQLLAEVA